MGIDKGTFDLIKAVEEIFQTNQKVRLILFGKFTDSLEAFAKSKPFVKVFGWCNRTETLEILTVADVACWPLHHTTLCEDAIACKTPLLIRKTETTEHLIEGNGLFMQDGQQEELKQRIMQMMFLGATDKENLEKSVETMYGKLSYNTIAQTIMQQVLDFQKVKAQNQSEE